MPPFKKDDRDTSSAAVAEVFTGCQNFADAAVHDSTNSLTNIFLMADRIYCAITEEFI